ncbi:PIN domain-containing protein [Schinkia azotoformans]|uniref:PIN domain-containing protein n=1 Tax=Schinkia azotoformans TaxID=1454 RepID=UPI002E1FAB46|nr:PIN domain-containing protein [Schinkia azotoformans]
MSSIIQYEDVFLQDFSQASVYVDACFILAYMDSTDPRGDNVSLILEKWKSDGIKQIGISNHVIAEVLHNLFKQEVLLALEIYHKKIVSKNKKQLIFDSEILEEGASFLYSICKKNIPHFYKKGFNINVSELIKDAKRFESQRHKLQPFYNNALTRYNEFIAGIQKEFKIEFLNSNEEIQELSKAYMRLFQLESYDAFHYAVAQYYQYTYFATLDGDFVHDLYNNQALTIILKIA